MLHAACAKDSPMDLWLFFKALYKHWWALMSCAAFTGIGIYASWSGKGSRWIVDASGVAAVILFVVAAFRAWKDEYLKAELAGGPPFQRRQATAFGFRGCRIPLRTPQRVRGKTSRPTHVCHEPLTLPWRVAHPSREGKQRPLGFAGAASLCALRKGCVAKRQTLPFRPRASVCNHSARRYSCRLENWETTHAKINRGLD